jgi:hypothetical protein
MSENIKDAVRKGRQKPGTAKGAKLPKPTHCKHGHPYTPENTYVYPNGEWNCRACRRKNGLRYNRERHARDRDTARKAHHLTARIQSILDEKPGEQNVPRIRSRLEEALKGTPNG